MNYLSRPVFQFDVNWSDPVKRAFTMDLRDVKFGFGAEVFTSRQQHVVNGWSVSLDLRNGQAVADFESFVDGRQGRLLGFWFPVPMRAFKIVAGVSGTQFDIADQGLRDTWTDSQDVHVYFDDGDTKQAAKITAVTLSGSNERVTLNATLSPAPSSNTIAYRLHYVRLAGDVEQAKYVRENHQRQPLRVIELPHEYTTAETGERPIYLYHFWASAPIDYHWFYTSFESNVISSSKEHVTSNITHGQLSQGVEFDADALDVSATYAVDHPLSLFLPVPNGRPINVQVSKCNYATPDVVTNLFTGQVRKVEDYGNRISARCDSFLSKLKQRIPALLIKDRCGYQLFDGRTCKAYRGKYQTSGHITAIDNTVQPPTVTCSLRFPTGPKIVTGYFAQGWMETGIRLDYELRTVFSSVWDSGALTLTMKLNAPLLKAIVGQEVQLMPGCDGLAETCRTKFNNFDNFPGFVDIPADNPSFKAFDNKTSAGDKK